MASNASSQPETKQCAACDATIGITEKECPKCHVDQEELESQLAELDRAQTILRKRRAAAKKAAEQKNVPPVPEVKKKKSLFRGLLGK